MRLLVRTARLDRVRARYDRCLAGYTVQADGSVRVVNFRVCARHHQPVARGRGQGLFTGAPTTGSLKVSFFRAVLRRLPRRRAGSELPLGVGAGAGHQLLLDSGARQAACPPQREAIVARAQALGVDTSSLIWVPHERQDPAH